jgi:hypothetical protein
MGVYWKKKKKEKKTIPVGWSTGAYSSVNW